MAERYAAIVSFTAKGHSLGIRMEEILSKCGYQVLQEQFGSAAGKRMPKMEENRKSAKEFVSSSFPRVRLLIFVGACGIAVRMISPYVRDKKTDPAVLVVDEQGHFVIPLLSGHLGGANRYARWLAEELAATAVITTATDLENRFAPDLFAEKYCMKIRSMQDAKAVAAAGLGQDVTIFIDVPWKGGLPSEQGADCISGDGRKQGDEESPVSPCVLITNREKTESHGSPQCVLTPANLVVGLGCRRGTDGGKIISFLQEILREQNLSADAVRCFASIDLKRGEQGLMDAADAFGVPFYTFSAEQLNRMPGDFSSSDFVRQHTGTDNVCERSAVLAGERAVTGGENISEGEVCVESGGEIMSERRESVAFHGGNMSEENERVSFSGEGNFLVRKQARDGVTLAIYEVPVMKYNSLC